MTYRVELSRLARRALTDELPEAVAAACWQLIVGPLRQDPRRVGKPLRPPFEGQWIARRSSYRVRYRIDDVAGRLLILDIRGRSVAYRP